MTISNKILSDITIFNKYSKYIPDLHRRESWFEICYRYEKMMLDKYPHLEKDIKMNMKFIYDRKVLPSMRAMQFAGLPIFKNESRIYNCAFLPIDDYRAFSETMFLLLGGTGVGYSVQQHHIDKLPHILKPIKEKKYIIGDSLEGWADAIKMLVKAYFGYTTAKPKFSFIDIRPKGSRLKTAGGKAPGSEPLRIALAHIEAIFERHKDGDKLSSLDCHDIQCHIADSVLSGGIRRSAMISLFSHTDKDMMECKFGNWWEANPQRGRSNNSVVLDRNEITEDQFKEIWKKVELSGSGEPGIYWTNNKDWGTNPCCEIALRPFQFCNLCEINVSDVNTEEELINRCNIASFFGTLQAGFTDFHYLRSIWKQTTEKDALIGIGMTGIASGKILKLNLYNAAEVVKNTNKVISEEIGVNKAARCTTIKPSGTTSCVLGTSSGIHAWHDQYYIRRITLLKTDPLYSYLKINHPNLLEDSILKSHEAYAIIPQEAPKGSILRTEMALDLLDRIYKFNTEWIKEGHRKGDNTNNVSATVSILKDNIYFDNEDIIEVSEENKRWVESKNVRNEWKHVGQWMWNERDSYNGISVLPYDGGTYTQAPFESCTKEVFDSLSKDLQDVDLTKVYEDDDNVSFTESLACSGDSCQI